MSISNIITTIKNIHLDQDCCARCKGKFEDEKSKKIVPFDDDDNFYHRRCAAFVCAERDTCCECDVYAKKGEKFQANKFEDKYKYCPRVMTII